MAAAALPLLANLGVSSGTFYILFLLLIVLPIVFIIVFITLLIVAAKKTTGRRKIPPASAYETPGIEPSVLSVLNEVDAESAKAAPQKLSSDQLPE